MSGDVNGNKKGGWLDADESLNEGLYAACYAMAGANTIEAMARKEMDLATDDMYDPNMHDNMDVNGDEKGEPIADGNGIQASVIKNVTMENATLQILVTLNERRRIHSTTTKRYICISHSIPSSIRVVIP
ncbi:hypothetical protein R1flu_005456 [Riccia fluitans]|uniref:Uncharacterized protein n=1 Tax=Riccia fluitans TaxID=41844 RepID=A0ABD1YT90_9MARC